jgi:hypothetical protein
LNFTCFKPYVFITFLLILLTSQLSFSQTTTKKDTIYIKDQSFEENAKYGARDSIYVDIENNKILLFGEAYLNFMDTKMNAGFIEVDLNKNEVFASYVYDKDSNKIEHPVFESEGEKIDAGKLRYNFDSEKGFIEEVRIKQDELYLYMGVAKRQQNSEVHFKQGRFTTCDLEDPHYHFHLTRAIMIPDKRIVTGPMNLWVKGVPTPFGLPFSIIPQSKTRTHGILFPQIVPSSVYGFGVRDLGYYFPISNTLNTSTYLTLLSRGSWGVRQETNYMKLYRNNGNLITEFQQLNNGFPNNDKSNKIRIAWTHRKDAKSNPFWTFSSNVNFISDNNTQNNLDPINTQYFNNQLNSDINLQRTFPGKPITMGLKLSLRQNTSQKNIALTSPIFTTTVTRFSPLKNIIKGKQEWKQFFSRMAISYNLESQNRSTFADSLLKQSYLNLIPDQFINGIQQKATLQTTASFFKNTLKFTPSINYTNTINFQQIVKSYDTTSSELISTQIDKTGMSNYLSFNCSLTTVLYSYYKFIGKSKPLLRHILTPSIGLSYIPDLNTINYLDTGSVTSKLVNYSPYERSLYAQGITRNQGLLTFGLNNSFELKRASEKDTLTGFKKTRIIDALSVTGNYDLLKDSMNLSNLSLSLRVSPFPFLNFVLSSSFSPYAWDAETGKSKSIYAYSDNQKLGRFINSNLTTSLTITSKQSKEKINELNNKIGENWNADYNYFMLFPERVVNFEIPWKLNLSHVYSITANQNISTSNPDKIRQVQTIAANGDLSFTKRWKIIGSVNYDVETVKVTYTTLALSRDMHCWALSFNWIPIGGNKSFLFSLRSTSNMFKDARIDFRKPPAFF